MIKYHKIISVVVIELSVRCLNTGPEDRLDIGLRYLIISGKGKSIFWKHTDCLSR